jgi:nucleoside-diphosphate-sugar epimerase
MLGRPGRPLFTRHAMLLLSRPQDFPLHKARSDLDFRSRVPFEEGVARAAEWAARQG